ncbi:hypothetical protein SGLAD_v1c09870 [Spiroplasma gladiatoris]|uniref:Uncharacterized protein n=1 Tax=Spiroplasma gladiatoris TaxID=2143 RepID=A0A4P7AKL1_9MOLU|nr:hypothetical protein [Spiroplasma gladiatoris]QBQ08186.1 hypothetical protein SGLAD_v1c09870 [Spiroplasma gladiatoris]
MSFKIKNAVFLNKKVLPQDVTFELNQGEVINVISNEKILLKNFKNILQGKYLVKSGVFKVDTFDKVNKNWTSKKVALIKPGSKLVRKWPEKLWLYISLLFNNNFYSKAKINLINSKYTYLSYSTSKNNQTDLNMRNKVEEMVKKFIRNSVEIEEQWLKEFLEHIIEFNDKNLEKENNKIPDHVKIILKDYYYLMENNANLELLQTFLQSLWDKVYSFIDLNSLCNCEYNAKNNKDKSVKKKAKELSFIQQNYVIRKQLKIIDVKISNIKRKLTKNRFILKSLEKQIKFELSKLEEKSFKKFLTIDSLFKWRQLALDQRFEFKRKQEKMFFSALLDESITIRGKIVEIMHKYHQYVLENKIVDGDKKEFNQQKLLQKQAIKKITTQANEWITSTVEELEMSFSLFNNFFKFSSINNIYFQLLEAIYYKKYNIIFYNVFQKLSSDDSDQLVKVVENLKKINKKFCVVFLENSLENIYKLKERLYIVGESKIEESNFSKLLKQKWNTYGSTFFHNKNRLAYSYDGKYLKIASQKLKITDKSINEKGQLLIDPLNIFLKKKESIGEHIEFVGKAKPTDQFKDKNIYEFVSKQGIKLYFYSTKTFSSKEKIKVYLSQYSILKFI